MKLAATTLTFCTAALVSLGLVILFNFSYELNARNPAALQALYCAVGLVAACVMLLLDYRHLRKLSLLLYLVTIGLLAWVLIDGVYVRGATRWLRLGPVMFQPSELAKLALIVGLAHYCERYQKDLGSWVRGLLIPGLLVGVVLALIFKEPDWGTTLLLAAVSGVMLLTAGVRWKHLLPVGLAGFAALAVMLYHNPTRLNRVLGWLDQESTREGVGMQAFQAKLAIGSGGLTGEGLGDGRHHGFVPIVDTDFIFAVIGEELGLACSLLVLLAFTGCVVSGIYIAWNAREPFGCFLSVGLTFLIGLQASINLGVVTGLLPNKGLPLPFLSRGGSSLAVMLLAVGILLSIARHSARQVKPAEMAVELDPLPASRGC